MSTPTECLDSLFGTNLNVESRFFPLLVTSPTKGG